jgi:hypothetical protein
VDVGPLDDALSMSNDAISAALLRSICDLATMVWYVAIRILRGGTLLSFSAPHGVSHDRVLFFASGSGERIN